MSVNEEEKKSLQQSMEQSRSRIAGYEQFVGMTGIPIPPAVNEKLTQIMISMAWARVCWNPFLIRIQENS